MTNALTPCAKWTSDGHDTRYYDGRLVSISCRYVVTGDALIKPGAHAAIHLNSGDPGDDGYGSYLTVTEKQFTGKDEADVKQQVEVWVKERFDKICYFLASLD